MYGYNRTIKDMANYVSAISDYVGNIYKEWYEIKLVYWDYDSVDKMRKDSNLNYIPNCAADVVSINNFRETCREISKSGKINLLQEKASSFCLSVRLMKGNSILVNTRIFDLTIIDDIMRNMIEETPDHYFLFYPFADRCNGEFYRNYCKYMESYLKETEQRIKRNVAGAINTHLQATY